MEAASTIRLVDRASRKPRWPVVPMPTVQTTLRLPLDDYVTSSALPETRLESSETRLNESDLKTTARKAESDGEEVAEAGLTSTESSPYGWVTGAVAIAGFAALSVIFKDDIQRFLQEFTDQVERMGTLGYFSYAGLYIVLETVAVPATPLTLAAGYLFGVLPGVCVVSVASTIAATLAFLASRYLFRQKAAEFFSSNRQFSAIDRAIAKDGFRFVFLLRLSPLLPFAASNYLYGLTSVPLGPYVLASWVGMLPGTWAYISAGNVGRRVIEGSGTGLPPWEIAAGLVVTVVVLLLTGSFARNALKEMDQEEA